MNPHSHQFGSTGLDGVRHENTLPPASSGPEHFVAAEKAAKFLDLHRRTLLERARRGTIPAHPMGDGPRKTWRFLLSELDRWLRGRVHSSGGAARVNTKRKNQ